MGDRHNQLKTGAILSYIQMGLSIIIGIVYTPVMLSILGKSEYGLYNTVSSTISMLSILSLGFGGAYIRYFSQYKARSDEQAISKFNALFLTIFTIIAAVAFVCGWYLSYHLDMVFDKGLTIEELEIAGILMRLLSLNLAITLLSTVFVSIISAYEEFVFQKLIGIIRTVASPMITLPILLLGYGSVGMVLSMVVVSLLADLASMVFCLKRLKVRFVFQKWEKGLLSSLLAYTGFIAINLIVDQVNWNIGKVMLGRFQGTATVAVYSIGFMLYQYYMQFASAVSGVFIPRVHQIENSNLTEGEKNSCHTELMIKVGRIQFLILGLLLSGLILFGKPFIRFWAGDGYENAYAVCLLLTIPTTIPLIQNIGIEIQRAKNKHQFRSVAYAIMACINLVSGVILCQKWGEIGSALGTAISLVIANGFVINVYYYRLHIDVLKFWKQIIRQMVGMIPPLVLGAGLVILRKPSTMLIMIAEIVVFSLLYTVCVWRLSMNEYEKNIVRKVIRKVACKSA